MDLKKELLKSRKSLLSPEELLLLQTRQVLHKQKFTKNQVLLNLKEYNESFALAEEENHFLPILFRSTDIERVAVNNRLHFLPFRNSKKELPYILELKINDYNRDYRKTLEHIFVLADSNYFLKGETNNQQMFFAKTVLGNYVLLHEEGTQSSSRRKYLFWPLRNFENLFLCVIALTLIITLILPTRLLTFDPHAVYWSMYRAACFFHVFIFNASFVVFLLFGMNTDLSIRSWDKRPGKF